MKLFKSTDEKLQEIGFTKVVENECYAQYEREDVEFDYVQSLDLYHKASGRHIMLSCQKEGNTDGFNNAVGLTAYEMKLVLKKMKELGFVDRK